MYSVQKQGKSVNTTAEKIENKNKFWKLSQWLQKLQEQFLCIPPKVCNAVDKIMEPFKRKSHQHVYIPAKPQKWAFNVWGHAGQSGFLYDVCQGAKNPDREKSNVGVIGDVVPKLTSTLPAGKNHNYFTFHISSTRGTPKNRN